MWLRSRRLDGAELEYPHPRLRIAEQLDLEPPPRGPDDAGSLRGRGGIVLATLIGLIWVAIAAGTVIAVMARDDDDNRVAARGVVLDVPSDHVPGAAGILMRCARAVDDRDDKLPVEPRLFGPRAAVITSDTTDGRTAAFIVGTNPRYYAQCNLSADGSNDWMREYDAAAAPVGGQDTVYVGAGTFTYFDRFPADVARVRLGLYGGGSVDAPAVNGFVVFASKAGFPVRITLLGGSGQVLAEGSWARLPATYDSVLPRRTP
jgi:hypothetical protein